MNIFVLATDPVQAAQFQCDKHVVKMVTETAQILCTVARTQGLALGYRATHRNHPCVVWARASADNFHWTLLHGLALGEEYTFRYGRAHLASRNIELIREHEAELRFEASAMTPFAQVVSDGLKGPDAVAAYRAYYLTEKARFAKWTKGRAQPHWWTPQYGVST